MAAIASPKRAAANPLAGFIAVQVAMLRRLRTAVVDIHVQNDPERPPILYCGAGHSLDSHKLFSLSDAGVEQVYVRTGEFQDFGAHLLECVESDRQHGEVPQTERFAALQLAVAVEIERSARLIDCGPYLLLSEKVSRDLTSLLAASNVLPLDLFRLARHDFNTFTHVTNVASYCVILAERLGICGEGELAQVATGAMLHDIGKRFVPPSILNKPARLSPTERAVIETHPQRGYEELCRREGLNAAQLMMVYQHHERVNGTGYPVGLPGGEIHPWAKMLAVVDVFDAMTGTRPYRRPAKARDALDYIVKNAGTLFDREVVECWNSAMNNA